MVRFFCAAFIGFLLLLPKPSVADGEQAVFWSFNEFCLNKITDIERVKSVAIVLGWEELSKDALNALAPLDKGDLNGWVVVNRGERFLLTTNKVPYAQINATACTLLTFDRNVKNIRRMIEKNLNVMGNDFEEAASSLNYIYFVRTDANIPVQVTVAASKENNNSVVKIEAVLQEKK